MSLSARHMDTFLRISTFLLLIFAISAGADNDTSINEHRVPRVSGRIVKVYSGNRPEPFMCSSEGFKADPNSCAAFYRCVKEKSGKFDVFRYQCAPGTVYDPDLETCNHPISTRRVECGGVMKTPDSTYANDLELQKVELPNRMSTDKLPGGIWISAQQLHTTTHITVAPTVSESINNIFTKPGKTPWTTNIADFDWVKTTSQPKLSNLKIDEICNEDGFTGDTQNCRKFYRCVGNQRGGFLRYEFFCSESTIWDEQIQSCNHPWVVKRSKCGRSVPITNKLFTTESISTPTTSHSEITTIPSEFGKKLKTVQQQLQISHSSQVSQTQTQISNSDQVVQNQTQINYGSRVPQNYDFVKQNQTQISNGSAVSQTQTQIDYGTKGMQTQLQVDHSKDSSQSQTQIQESSTSQSVISTSSPNQNNQCSESGFIGDANDCKKFYRCVDNGRGGYTRYEYSCGEGTVWDQSIEACNHAWAVKECGGQSSSDSHSSSTVQSTTYKQETTTTQNEDTTTTKRAPHSTSESQSGSETTTTTRKPQYQTTKKPQNDANYNNECTSSGFVGDSDNCKKFYRCVDNGNGGYTKYEFTCGEGTVWDSSIEACNHAWAVKECGGNSETSEGSLTTTPVNEETIATSTITAAPVDKNTDDPISTTKGYSTTTTKTPNIGNECKESGFMGDNKNCKKFYRCVDNGDGTYTRYEFSCGEGTVWDSKIDACNHEWAVEKCGGNKESPSSTTRQPILQDENNEPTTEMNGSETTTQISTTTVKNQLPVSDQECNSSGFVGDKNDCKKFYRCVDNGNGGYDRYEFSCGEGTVWDDSISACNHAWAVKSCGAAGTTAQSNVESTSESITSSTTVNQDSTQHTTDKGTSTSEHSSANEVDGDCTREGFFSNVNDCKKFIRCVDDGNEGFTKYEFTCGEGTTWNQNIKACDHPSLDRPCGQIQQSTTETGHVYDELPDTTTVTSTGSTSTTKKEESQQTQKPAQTSSGKCESEGFYGNPSDCKKFYRCVDDGNGGYIKYDFTCGEGTVWNQEILTCDHEPDDKSCLNSGLQPTDGTGTGSQSQSTTESTSESITSSSTTTLSQGPDNASSSNDNCNSEGFFPNSQDCKKFIRCVDDGQGGYTKYEFSCGQGTVWVQKLQTCDHDNGQSNCSYEDSNIQQPMKDEEFSQTESSPPQKSTTSSSTSDNSNTQSNNTQESSSKKPSSSKDVKCEKAGFYPDPDDCKKFYRCVDWDGEGERFSVYHFECGEGTIWDPAVDTCNHEESVYPPRDCSQSQSEPSETTTQKQEETTKQQTTTQQTTTQESTTDEQTTTQQSTTSKQTTSEPTTTKSTTQKSTTAKQTTSEATTTQESTTNEQTTSEQTTTQQTTTQESTTDEQTTSEQTTTQQSTTQESTTDKQTTTQQTSEQTTQEQTTQDSTTESNTDSTTENNTDGTTESSTDSTTENNTDSTTESEQESTTQSSSDDECPKTEDDQYLFVCPTSFKRHPKYCNMFYQCDEDEDTHEVKIATFKCPNETIYDESQTKCVEEKKADKKCNGEMARRHRFRRQHSDSKEPITADMETKSCQSEGNYPFESKVECSKGFLKCKKSKTGKLRGYVNQCPEGFLFWQISKRCEFGRQIRDCKRSTNDWSGRWNIPIDRKNIAF